jgi:hypothetical protein
MRAQVGSGVVDQPRARAALGNPRRAWFSGMGCWGMGRWGMGRWAMWAVAFVATGLAFAASPRGAAAQTTSNQSLGTLSSPNNAIRMIPSQQGVDRVRDYYTPTRPWWINYEDCLANDRFIFTLTSTVSGDTLEIWAGSENCATNRSDNDMGQCWILAAETLTTDTIEVSVPVRNILARRLNTVLPPVSVSSDVCDDSTDATGEELTLYFMVVNSGQGDEYFAWDGSPGGVGFDVVGPEPPGRISVGIGESQLAIRLDDVPTDPQRERYEAFCVPEGTTLESLGRDADAGAGSPSGDTPSAADAGDGGVDAGLDAGSSSVDAGSGEDPDGAPAACFTDVLRVGQRPPPEFSCGEANAVSGTVRTGRLANNVNYAVAVSGQDSLGNAGPISQIQCGRPIPLTDFWELYSQQGGPGGGGFCNLSPGQQRAAGALGVTTLMLAMAGLGWRRRKGRA